MHKGEWDFSRTIKGKLLLTILLQEVVKTGIVKKMIFHLSHKDIAVRTPALRTIGNIVTGDDLQTQVVRAPHSLLCLDFSCDLRFCVFVISPWSMLCMFLFFVSGSKLWSPSCSFGTPARAEEGDSKRSMLDHFQHYCRTALSNSRCHTCQPYSTTPQYVERSYRTWCGERDLLGV